MRQHVLGDERLGMDQQPARSTATHNRVITLAAWRMPLRIVLFVFITGFCSLYWHPKNFSRFSRGNRMDGK